MTASPAPAGSAVDDLGLVDEADAEAGQVPFPGAIEAGELRRLPADQGAAGLAAAPDDAPDDVDEHARHDLADGDIVQEEERLGPEDDDVVDGHGHEIDAHGVVFSDHRRR